jgi:protocatechuate 3,4-dioxygenase beta subunit
VPDAAIWIHAERLESVRIANTDARGEFHLDHIGPGMSLQACKAGLAPSKAHPVLGKRGETWQVQLTMPGEAGEVAGRVVDPNGAPVEDALVAFVPDAAKDLTPYDRNGPQTRSGQVRTDAEGRFHSREVPLGTVIATAAGSHSDWTPASIRIEVGPAPQHVELALGNGAVLEGTITEAGKPIQGCTLHVFCSQPDVPASYLFNLLGTRSAISDAQGKFRITGILPGQVEMRVLRKGLESLGQQTVAMAAGETLRWDLDCGAAGQTFEITLDPTVPPSGSGAWLVQVNGDDESKGFVGLQAGDGKGRARFERLPPGRYTAVVHYRGVIGDLIPMTTREFDTREERLTLQIPPERLRMQPVRGRLLDVAGTVIQERSVQVVSADGGYPMVLQRSTGLDGGFDFAALPAGNYILQLLEEGAPVALREFSVVGDRAEDLGDVRTP